MKKLPKACEDCAEYGSDFCEDCLKELVSELPENEKITLSKALRNIARSDVKLANTNTKTS